MSTFSAIITCHDSTVVPLLSCLGGQTRRPDEILVGQSDSKDPTANFPNLKGCTLTESSPGENDFGYAKRNRLAKQATGEWLGFFCHDDSYHPEYIERMMAFAGPETDVVWCPWNDIPGCEFAPAESTLGNFIIRRELFLKLGAFAEPVMGQKFKTRLFGEITVADQGMRDAVFIMKVKENTSRIEKQPFLLYFHNVPFDKSVKATSWGRRVAGASYEDWMRIANYRLKNDIREVNKA